MSLGCLLIELFTARCFTRWHTQDALHCVCGFAPSLNISYHFLFATDGIGVPAFYSSSSEIPKTFPIFGIFLICPPHRVFVTTSMPSRDSTMRLSLGLSSKDGGITHPRGLEEVYWNGRRLATGCQGMPIARKC